jgi:uncharacterized protein
MSEGGSDEQEVSSQSLFEPSPKNPVLICGLPGSGYVGKLAADHLISVFKAKKFLDLFSPSFPPHVNVGEDGRAELLTGELYFCETGQESDLLVFTSDAQPATSKGEYHLSDVVLEEAKKHGVKTVYSLAAYITGGFSREQKVFGTSTSSNLLPKLSEKGVQIMKEGGITGMNGIMIGMAKLHGMEGVCLLGETSGYLIDPSASQSVLESLARILNLKIDMSSLSAKAKETQQIIGQIQRMAQSPEASGDRQQNQNQPGYIG